MPTIQLQTPHEAQRQVIAEASRFNVVDCGRRWGKTQLGVTLALSEALDGHPVGWFAPTYKLLRDGWTGCLEQLRPFGKAITASKTDKLITLPTGGSIEFWTLAPAEAGTAGGASDAGRGRKYRRGIVDEAAKARYLETDWTRSIRPTLSDLQGDSWFLSTPRGMGYFHKLWTKGQARERGWRSWKMPTASNPYILAEEIEAARLDLPVDAFSQEYLAEFLADASNPFGITAIRACIAEMAEGPVDVWGVDLAKSTDWAVAIGLNAAGNVCAFQRWQSDWRNTRARLMNMIQHAPALVDSTGVGDPIVEDLKIKCANVEGQKFTAGTKQQLMEGLAYAIQQRRVSFPDGLIVNELETFMYEYRPSGVRYTAPEGMHDDCVDALALAVMCRARRPEPVQFSTTAAPGEAQERNWWSENVENEAIWS